MHCGRFSKECKKTLSEEERKEKNRARDKMRVEIRPGIGNKI